MKFWRQKLQSWNVCFVIFCHQNICKKNACVKRWWNWLWSISSIFYEQLLSQYSFAKKFHSQNVSRKKLRKTLSYKKVSSNMLMKLTPGNRTFELFPLVATVKWASWNCQFSEWAILHFHFPNCSTWRFLRVRWQVFKSEVRPATLPDL